MKNSSLLLLILSLAVLPCTAQVGINKDDPDPSSILHIDDTYRGVIFPRIANDAALTKTTDGLIYYNTTEKRFRYYNGTEWQCVNPWNSTPNPNEIVTDKAVIVNNTIKGFGTTPLGGIIMWSGDVSTNFDGTGKGTGNLNGWAICNGANGTPDLRGRFIVGYNGTSYTLGATGGNNSVTLTAANIPPHKHSVQGEGATINITSSGSHNHTGTTTAILKKSKSVGKNSGSGEGAQDDGAPVGGITINNQVHTHPNSSFNGVVGDGSGNGLGTQTNIDIRPQYYSLLYIMRIQ